MAATATVVATEVTGADTEVTGDTDTGDKSIHGQMDIQTELSFLHHIDNDFRTMKGIRHEKQTQNESALEKTKRKSSKSIERLRNKIFPENKVL